MSFRVLKEVEDEEAWSSPSGRSGDKLCPSTSAYADASPNLYPLSHLYSFPHAYSCANIQAYACTAGEDGDKAGGG
jgi:hypothetical protein